MAMSLRVCALAALLSSACQPSPTAAPQGPVLARGTGLTVTASDLRDRLVLENEMTRGAVRDPARKHEFVNQVIDEELMLAEARRQKLDQAPEFKATVRTLLLQQLRQARARARAAAGPVADAAQQVGEERAWAQSLREQAHVQLDEAAIGAFVP